MLLGIESYKYFIKTGQMRRGESYINLLKAFG